MSIPIHFISNEYYADKLYFGVSNMTSERALMALAVVDKKLYFSGVYNSELDNYKKENGAGCVIYKISLDKIKELCTSPESKIKDLEDQLAKKSNEIYKIMELNISLQHEINLLKSNLTVEKDKNTSLQGTIDNIMDKYEKLTHEIVGTNVENTELLDKNTVLTNTIKNRDAQLKEFADFNLELAKQNEKLAQKNLKLTNNEILTSTESTATIEDYLKVFD